MPPERMETPLRTPVQHTGLHTPIKNPKLESDALIFGTNIRLDRATQSIEKFLLDFTTFKTIDE